VLGLIAINSQNRRLQSLLRKQLRDTYTDDIHVCMSTHTHTHINTSTEVHEHNLSYLNVGYNIFNKLFLSYYCYKKFSPLLVMTNFCRRTY
jgi:hypothetical protein